MGRGSFLFRHRLAAYMKKRTIWLLGALNMIGPFTFDAYLAALPQMSRDLHTTAAGTQITVMANLAGMTLGMLFGGSLSDSFGRRKPIIWALVLYVLASLAIAGSNSVELVIVLRVLQGLAGGAMVSTSQAIVRDRTEGNDSARMYSLLMLIKSIAPVLAPTVGALLLLFGSWRTIFLFLAFLGAGFLVWSITSIQDTLHDDHKVRFTIKNLTGSWGSIFRDRLFLAGGIGNALGTFALFGYLSTATFALQGDYGLTPVQFGLFMGSNGVALILARSINTRLLARKTFHSVYSLGVVVGFIAAIILVFAAIFHGQFWLLISGLYAMTASMGFMTPNTLNLSLTNHKKNAGAAAGLAGLVGSIAGFLSTSTISTFVGTSSTSLAIYIAIPLALTGTSLLLYKKPKETNA
jgi:DHA1 family bicyclomycin/chloramphenicol resistance-like MFS transporter